MLSSMQPARCALVNLVICAFVAHFSSALVVDTHGKRQATHAFRQREIESAPALTGLSLVPVALGSSQCGLLAAAFLVRPKPTCKYVDISSNGSACFCTIYLPPSLKNLPAKADPAVLVSPPSFGAPSPAALLSPPPGVADRAALAATTPTFPPLQQVTPALTPLGPYTARPMAAECPFSRSCSNDNCVGYDSFGFSHALMASPTPGSEYLHTMGCMYVMKPGTNFVVPSRVSDLWNMENNRLDPTYALHYAKHLDLQCEGLYLGNTLKEFCQDMILQMNTSCSKVWAEVVSTRCSHAPPPVGFNLTSALWQVCPFECELNERNWGQHQHVLSRRVTSTAVTGQKVTSVTAVGRDVTAVGRDVGRDVTRDVTDVTSVIESVTGDTGTKATSGSTTHNPYAWR